MTEPESILLIAQRLVTGDRNAAHGDFAEDMADLAATWSARFRRILKRPLHPHEAALLLCDFKLNRAMRNPAHRDNWIDLAGYAYGADVTFRAQTKEKRDAEQS